MSGADEHESGVNADSEAYPDVCVVTHPLGAAGENATRTLLEILAAITSVRLVTADLPADSEIRDRHTLVELTHVGAGQSNVVIAAVRFVLNQIRMCRAIAGSDDEVVLFFGATAYVLPMLWARMLGRIVVVEPRGNVPLTLRLDWERRMPESLARLLVAPVSVLERVGYRIANAIITYTPGMAEELDLSDFGDKLYPNGARYVDTEMFAVRTPLTERDSVVGFLGRLDEEKGVRALADVAKRLPEDVTFRFVGDGPLREWLEKTLSDERTRGTVEFAGWVPHSDVPAELNRMSVLILPSQPTEGLPTVILEALACGTPVCVKPVSGVPDVVEHGVTGYLLRTDDPAEIAGRIERILDEDLEAVSSRGRKRIAETYSLEAAIERYERILDDIS